MEQKQQHIGRKEDGRENVWRAVSFLLIFTLLFALSGCSRPAEEGAAAGFANADSNKVVRIGYQKYGTFNLLKVRGSLEKRLEAAGYTVQWSEFPGGPQLLEALNAGKIDLGHTGEAPPIFAQAAGAPLVYLAHEPSSPKSEAILVPSDSSIRSVKDLKGKKVALNKGSNVHYLLVKQLEKAGLHYQDIQPVYLPPADARAAFARKSVDAWVIWDPYFAAAETSARARILADGTATVFNHEFYLASRSFAEKHPNLVQGLLDELRTADAWAQQNQQAVARLLAPQMGIDVPSLERAAARRAYGVQPMTDQVVAEQQKIADTFFQLGLIPKKIQVKDAIWQTNHN